jgi:hypothetical protein
MPNVEPGAAAKLLLVAEAQHRDPENFGGLDLIGAIVGDEGAGGGAPGQYVNPDDTQYSSSVINQSLAVLALANTTNTAGQPSADAVSFLGGQQCADGGFQNAIRSGSTACDPAAEQVDATSYAIQALIVGGDRSRAADALSWLGQAENNNGGWDGVSGKSDANSTALAVESLVAGHKKDGAGLAWLSRAQLGCSSSAGKRGAVQSDGKTYDVSTAVRATSQAGVALAGLSLTGVDRNGGTKAEPVLACPKHHKKK